MPKGKDGTDIMLKCVFDVEHVELFVTFKYNYQSICRIQSLNKNAGFPKTLQAVHFECSTLELIKVLRFGIKTVFTKFQRH